MRRTRSTLPSISTVIVSPSITSTTIAFARGGVVVW
jgi:hypothetical protein